MSYEPPRQQLLDKAAEVLRGMTGIRWWGGAYPSDPVVTVGEDCLYSNAPQFPYLGLLPGPGSKAEATTGHVTGSIDRFRALLYGYVEDSGGVGRTRWLMRLVRDCQRTLRQSAAFGELRPGTTLPFADYIEFEEEDLVLHPEGTGAEFCIPLMILIPDELTT